MANRVIRGDILTSDSVNSLSFPAEVFYRRLMSVVDDYGRYDGRISLLRVSLYPLQINKVSEIDINIWIKECFDAKLIIVYEVENKPYLEILKFNQVLRIKKSKYPCYTHVIHTIDTCTSETNRNESETNPKRIENLIIIQGEKFLKKGSEVLQNEYRSILYSHMRSGCSLYGFTEKQILDKFDSEYPNYEFRDRNHLSNAVKGIGEKLKPKKQFNQPEQNIKASSNYGKRN